MTQALYRKWRSQTFEEVVGQEHVTQTLRNALRDDRVAHAYLFSGPRGTGKTSTARILAKALNCTAPVEERPCNQCETCSAINEGRMIDLIEIDAASNNSVEDVRELRDKVGFRPSEGRYKIYIVDEVHMLSTNAFNALLKTLEEPPPHTRFVLATTEPHKIPATVLSRCQRFDFRRIPVPEICAHLHHIVTSEGFAAEDEALTAIARSAQGCMRDAISLLDQMFSYGTDAVTLEQVQQALGAVDEQTIVALVDALAAKDVTSGLKLIQRLVIDGSSLTEYCHQVVEHLRGVMVIQMTGDGTLLNDLAPELVEQMAAQAKNLERGATLHAVKRFSEAIQELKGGYQPQLPLELALIESIQGPIAAAVPGMAAAATAGTPASGIAGATAQPTQTGGVRNGGGSAPAPPVSAAQTANPEEVTQESDTAPPLDKEAVAKMRVQFKQFANIVRDELGDKSGRQVHAALQAVKDVAIAEDSVAFAFGGNTFSRDLVAKPETLKEVTAILSRFLGRPVHLDCQMGTQARLSNLVGTTHAAEQGAGPDPLVQYAIEDLGAELVE